MSIHKSLITGGKLVRARNVLKRAERINELERSGKWSIQERSPFGLPKVRVLKVKKRGKEKKKEEGEAAKEGAAAPAGEAAPAAAGAAKAAAPGKAGAPSKDIKAPAAKEAKK